MRLDRYVGMCALVAICTVLVAACTASGPDSGGAGTGPVSGATFPPLSVEPPVPEPVISTGVPAFSNPGSYSAARANGGDYSVAWRGGNVPSKNSPDYLIYDLSTVPKAHRSQVIVDWHNDATYDYLLQSGDKAYNLPRDYTLDANSQAGGTVAPPFSGWVTLLSVTGNLYNARAHPLNLAGYNWLRMSIIASSGSPLNEDVALRMDVHDASLGNQDSWLMLGDSITAGAFQQATGATDTSGGEYAQLVSAATGGRYFPLVIDGGIGYTTMDWASAHHSALLANVAERYVAIAYGSNDAHTAHPLSPSEVLAYYNNLLAMIDALPARVVPVVPLIPWGCADGGLLGSNAQLLNAYVSAHLSHDRPQALRGPDLWTLFQRNPGYVSGDCLHPSDNPAHGQAMSGYDAYIHAWRDWALRVIYHPGSTDISAPLPMLTAARLMDNHA